MKKYEIFNLDFGKLACTRTESLNNGLLLTGWAGSLHDTNSDWLLIYLFQ